MEIEIDKNKKQKTIIICLCILIIVLLCLVIVLLTRINQLENMTKDHNPCDISEENTLDITKRQYYDKQLLTEDNYEDAIKGIDEYLIYFHQDDCGFCGYVNYEIDKYLSMDDNNIIPIYFATLQSYKYLFDMYDVEKTPELIYREGDYCSKYKGTKEIIDFLQNELANQFNH